MYIIKSLRFLSIFFLLTACNQITAESTTSATSAASSARFASGTKGVKIITSDTTAVGSFAVPTATPSVTPIPTGYPGADGTTTYRPGISAATYYDLDGTTGITKPSWLLDFQMGITSVAATGGCAAFGSGGTLDPLNFYRVSESNCTAASDGTGLGTDKVFFRIILDRDTAKIGSAENLLVQVEYQASGIHANSDGTGATAESNLDQLWKIYWNSSLAASVTAKSFGIFVPPNYSACEPAGAGFANAHTASDNCFLATHLTYRGSPVKVRQFVIPLSAYPTLNVIQFSRVMSRITNPIPADAYVGSFCNTDDPLCLGVVIRSVTITRM